MSNFALLKACLTLPKPLASFIFSVNSKSTSSGPPKWPLARQRAGHLTPLPREISPYSFAIPDYPTKVTAVWPLYKPRGTEPIRSDHADVRNLSPAYNLTPRPLFKSKRASWTPPSAHLVAGILNRPRVINIFERRTVRPSRDHRTSESV